MWSLAPSDDHRIMSPPPGFICWAICRRFRRRGYHALWMTVTRRQTDRRTEGRADRQAYMHIDENSKRDSQSERMKEKVDNAIVVTAMTVRLQ